jgi:hypothetical protein
MTVAHSITSSARASNDGGTSRPSALAVLRLTAMFELRWLQHWKFSRIFPL